MVEKFQDLLSPLMQFSQLQDEGMLLDPNINADKIFSFVGSKLFLTDLLSGQFQIDLW